MKKGSRKVTGVLGWCCACGNRLWLHPDLMLCGCCATGEADEINAFAEPWYENRSTRRLLERGR